MRARSVLLLLTIAFAPSVQAAPYSYLNPEYEQQAYAVGPSQITSLGFAPNGDIWALQSSPNALLRFDSHDTQVVHGTSVHPLVQTQTLPAVLSPFQGIANHPNGRLYLVAVQQTAIADATTGSVLQLGPWGYCGGWQAAASPTSPCHLAAANGWGDRDIDPNTLGCTDLYIGSTQFDYHYDTAYDQAGGGLVSAVTQQLGTYPFETYRHVLIRYTASYGFGGIVEVPARPSGVALLAGFHRVIAALEDGSLVETDMDSANPTPQVFASGGFPSPAGYGAIVRLGPDGALYVLQPGTRYDDGTVTSEFSIVRISPRAYPTQQTSWGRLKASYR